MPTTAFQNRSALLFVPNQGQTNEKARFLARINGHQFYFLENGIAAVTYAHADGGKTDDKDALLRDPLHKRAPVSDTPTRGAALFLTFEGAAKAEPQGQKQAAGRFHYFTGNDPANWHTGLPSYEQLLYANLYDGVDLTLLGSEGGLKFLWLLKQASGVGTIRIRYEGAEEIRISEDGSLIIRHALGEMIDPAPVAWQVIGGEKKPVACSYALYGNTVSFTLSGEYDANALLFIDPILPYSTYLGGSMGDSADAISVDSAGCAYVAGGTQSLNFPVTPGAFQTTLAGSLAAFLTKMAADGATLVYSTYLGGELATNGIGVAIDTALCAYLTGYTNAADFPVTPGAFQTTPGANYNAFVTKVSADGASLVYSTFLGGNYLDYGHGIAVDAQGCAYVTGMTGSSNFPVTAGAFQTALSGFLDSYLTKLSPTGASLVYSTYFGGNDVVWANDIAIDTQLCAYITGYTDSTGMPVTLGAFQTVYGGGDSDVFVTKLTADGSALVYSTFLGGSAHDTGFSIAVDAQNIAHVTGSTNSTDFPVTPGAFQPVYGGGTDYDGFITNLSPDGGSLIGSTYLGGSYNDIVKDVALDLRGNVYVTGITGSPNFPITPQVVVSSLQGEYDAFVSTLSPDLSRLLVSFYIGGSNNEDGTGIALGKNGAVYVAGSTSSLDFPVTPGAFQTAFAGIEDAFVTKEGFVLLKKASILLQQLQ